MIREISFEIIKQIWEQHLWIDRHDIVSMSSMLYEGGYNIDIYKKYKPKFFAYYIDEKIVGVNSGHSSSKIHYRSRGLWVSPDYRKKGIGTNLLKHTMIQGKKEDKVYCWSLPRKQSLATYLNAGFEQTSDFFETETNELNCYVIKEL
jgi:GNAT superfamily N-acetyltransferase